MDNLKKIVLVFLLNNCIFQVSGQPSSKEEFSKHEIGFSVGAFPMIGGWSDGFLNPKP